MNIDRVAIITGAGQGIGQATAIALAKAGYSLALLGRNPIDLAQSVDRCKSHGTDVRAYSIELSKLDRIEPLVQQIRKELGAIDVLINNAGIFVEKPFAESRREETIDSFTVNYFAITELIRSSLPFLQESSQSDRNPAIINIGSSASRQGYRNGSLYAPTKAALKSLTESLRIEFQSNGIGVTLIEPGVVNTKMHQGTTKYDPSQMIQPDEVAQVVLFTLQFVGSALPTQIALEPKRDPRIRPNTV